MATYLIDYENTSHGGLIGITNLTADDTVCIFHNRNTKSMPFTIVKELLSSLAKIEFVETVKVAKNYLDFQLSTHLGFLIGNGLKDNIYIISNDTGFDSIVDYWTARKYTIQRQSTICNSCGKCSAFSLGLFTNEMDADENIPANTEDSTESIITSSVSTLISRHLPINKMSEAEYKGRTRKLLKDKSLSAQNFLDIYNISRKSRDKQDLHNFMVMKFGHAKGLLIYDTIKDLFVKYKVGA